MSTYRSIKLAATAVGAITLAALLLVSPASAVPVGASVSAPQVPQRVVVTHALAAEAAASTDATAQPGDGVIRITTRVCGSADGWQAVAADNGIVAPVYLVLLGQTLTVTCGQSAPATTDVPAASEPAPAPAVAPSVWADPLPGSTPFCNYWQWRGSYNHAGEDIPAGMGTPIYAAGPGVITTGWQQYGAGNYQVIAHDDGSATVYMHESSFERTSGRVSGGEVIGYVGSTGDSQGSHLHFETHPWGAWQGTANPSRFLAERGVALGC